MRTLDLVIRVPQTEDEVLQYSIIGDFDPEDTLSLLLMAANGIYQTNLIEQMEANDPLLNGDLRFTIAHYRTRMRMLDMVMHLPVNEGEATTTELDL